MTPATVPSKQPNSPDWWAQPLLWLLPLLLLAWWLRLSFLLGSVYFFDEYISMLAAQMTAQKGAPILPSGLFYDHGLLLSYLAGALVALIGFKEEVARWPVLLLSTFTIAAYYFTARQLFNSRLAGLLAAALAALDEWSIIWGTRARMYTPAHLFVLLSVTWLLLGMLKQPKRLTRYLGLAFLAAALLSHTITFLILPPLALLLLIFILLYHRGDWLRQRQIWPEVGLAGLVLGGIFTIVALGQTDTINALQDPLAQAPPPFGLEFLRGFFLPGIEWTRFDNLFGFFEADAYEWLQPFIGLSLLLTLYRLFRHQATFAEIALLFLALFWGLVIFGLGALLTDTWSKSRYIFILTLPAFLLLSAGSLAQLLHGLLLLLPKLWPRQRPLPDWVEAVAVVAGVALIAAQWGPAAWRTAYAQGSGDYNTAFNYVREQWQPDDRIMTIHPSAAWLYLERCDYYANQATANVLGAAGEQDENTFIDRFTGSPLIDSVDKLNAALAQKRRLWFVVDQLRLFERFEPFFSQQVLAQMELVYQTGAVQVFLSRPYPTPLAAEAAVQLEANFSDTIHLQGYTLDPARITPDGTLPLGLYWQPSGSPTRQLKVFVQMRNAQGQTIAQADHFLLDGLLTLEVWQALQKQNEPLRDTADLRLPQPWPAEAGPYRLYVGFYDPNTLERVPLVNDTSGENAVVIRLYTD